MKKEDKKKVADLLDRAVRIMYPYHDDTTVQHYNVLNNMLEDYDLEHKLFKEQYRDSVGIKKEDL